MKTAEVKTTSSTIQRKNENTQSPFFKKDGESTFFTEQFSNDTSNTQPFFSPSTIQPKLTIGQPNDKYEVEADQMADKVVQRLADPVNQQPINHTAPSNIIQHKCSDCEEKEHLQKKEGEEEMISKKEIGIQRKPIFESNDDEASSAPRSIQRKCSSCGKEEDDHIQEKSETAPPNTASSDLQSRLNSSKGSGSAMPKATSESMGSAFGTDFSGVRIHTDSQAVQMNQELGAQAFTHGSDIYFNQGKYDTGSTGGQHLLAHELTHTVQQGGTSTIQREPFEVGIDSDNIKNIGHTNKKYPIGKQIGKLGRIGARLLGTEKVIEKHSGWWGEYEVEKEVDKDNYQTIKTLGKKVYEKPGGGGTYFRAKYNEMVQVVGSYKYDSSWLLIASGNGKGWIPGFYVHYPVPDFQSELYYIREGEMLKDVIAKHYGGQGVDLRKWGADVRLYVHAIAIVNEAQGKKGLGYYKGKQDVSLFRELTLDKSGEASHRIWKSIYLKKGHNIWLPSTSMIQDLKNQGLASAGSVSHTIVEFVKDFFLFSAGLIVGVFEGIWAAFTDIFSGIVDLFELAGTLIKKILNGELLSFLEEIWEGLKESISNLDKTAKSIWDEFMKKSAFDKGRAVGKIIGYIIFEILLAIFTAGVVTAIKWAGKAGKLAKVFGALGKIANKAKKVTSKVKTPSTKNQKLLKEAAEKRRTKPDVDGKHKTDTDNSTGNKQKDLDEIKDKKPGEKFTPNKTYTDNGYTYVTNEHGWVSRVEGKLKLKKGKRKSNSKQTEVGKQGISKKGKKYDADADEGGHLVGDRFDGSGNTINLVPQNANLNRGKWNKMENEWARKIREGKEVKVDIEIIYDSDGVRPSEFKVKYQIGKDKFQEKFKNIKGG